MPKGKGYASGAKTAAHQKSKAKPGKTRRTTAGSSTGRSKSAGKRKY